MIQYDFEYYKPESVPEAVEIFQTLMSQGKQPVYYSGGTEIITLGRLGKLSTGAVVDIKGIPECNVLDKQNGRLIMGAGVSLTRLAETNLFPLLTESAGRVADHTSRGKITLGGNLCGSFIYREAVLSLLASDSSVIITGSGGTRTVPLMEAFREQLQLAAGEFLVQVTTDETYLNLPHKGVKKTRLDRINYPLVAIAVLKTENNRLQIAVSGLCSFPFRSLAMENELNSEGPPEQKVTNALQHIPAPVLDDVEGTAGYRQFVLKNTLLDVLATF
ncbi:Hypothetical protein LUCI_0421 [Lucifera butyrica]|uniref:FAD-binding PCMH-type domain-containing protein n=1 Tax=Lucifera butyrica TaxID=1351585 RepID=A0A498R1A3_9FIRM|nr:FAD binding domain-containing protein [Lucifera butyrica]VBB05214.1 Hypothetical protein LUCI_0421 [Lucifera butyrica]